MFRRKPRGQSSEPVILPEMETPPDLPPDGDFFDRDDLADLASLVDHVANGNDTISATDSDGHQFMARYTETLCTDAEDNHGTHAYVIIGTTGAPVFSVGGAEALANWLLTRVQEARARGVYEG